MDPGSDELMSVSAAASPSQPLSPALDLAPAAQLQPEIPSGNMLQLNPSPSPSVEPASVPSLTQDGTEDGASTAPSRAVPATEQATPRASTSAAPASISPSASASGSVRKRGRGRVSTAVAAAERGGAEAGDVLAATDSVRKLPFPRYTVEKRAGTKAEPHVISFGPGVTDAEPARWPTDGTRYRATVWGEKSKSGQPGKWELWLSGGQKSAWNVLASQLGIREGDDCYAIAALPDGYKLFAHATGDKAKPRWDTYLFGSRINRDKFRTTPEFLPHLKWLLTADESNKLDCECGYCTGIRSQTEVNRQQGIKAAPKKEPADPYNNIDGAQFKKPRREHKEQVSPGPTYLGTYTNQRMDSELTDDGALYRQSELVWLKLSQPLKHSTDPRYDIQSWPGIVIERRLKVESTVDGFELSAEPSERNVHVPKVTNTTSWAYQLQLLAVKDIVVANQTDIRPWLGIISSEVKTDDLASERAAKFVLSSDEVRLPELAAFAAKSEDGMTAYALALQIVANINQKFSHVTAYVPEDGHIKLADGIELTPAEAAAKAGQAAAPHFQSVWWGPEHIYAGELVRVTVEDDLIDRKNTRQRSAGGDSRALFFKLNSFFRSQFPDGQSSVCMMTGALVELVKISADSSSPEEIAAEAAAAAEEQPSVALPAAPSGYRFRVLTHPGVEVHLDLEWLAGRYYPLPAHLARDPALVEQELARFAQISLEEEAGQPAVHRDMSQDLLAVILAGLLPAGNTYIRAQHWSEDRHLTLTRAETAGNEDMINFFKQQRKSAGSA